MAILPGIQQERQRQHIQSMVADRSKLANNPPGGEKKAKNEEERNGGDDWRITQWPNTYGTELAKYAYPTGPTLIDMEQKM